MNNLATLLILSFFVVLSGCDGKKEAQTTKILKPAARDSVGLEPTAQEQAATEYVSGQWGHIGTESQFEEAFNANLKNLVSATMDPNQLGFVSAVDGQSTYVRFRGRVHIGAGNKIDKTQSFLRILIKDEHVGSTYEGQVIPEIALYFAQATSGSLSGDKLIVTFADEYGEITLDGKINHPHAGNTYFLGTLRYKNLKHFANETPFQGDLGGFSIPMSGLISQ